MSNCEPTDRLMQSIKLEAPGVTDAMLKIVVFNVVDQFFRRTNTWKWREEMPLELGTREYEFSTPNNSAIVRLMGVSHNGMAVDPTAAAAGITMSSLGTLLPDQVFPDGDADYLPEITDLDQGTGLFTYAIYRPNYISISAAPSTEDIKYPLEAWFVLSLSRGCLECDCGDWPIEEWMYDMFFQDWLDGSLARLFAMPAKPWSNPAQAVVKAKSFRNDMAFRMQEARRGYVYNVPAWRFPKGW